MTADTGIDTGEWLACGCHAAQAVHTCDPGEDQQRGRHELFDPAPAPAAAMPPAEPPDPLAELAPGRLAALLAEQITGLVIHPGHPIVQLEATVTDHGHIAVVVTTFPTDREGTPQRRVTLHLDPAEVS